MNNFIFKIILGYSSLIAFVIALIRIKNIRADFYPFVLLIFIGLLNETLSVICIYTHNTNAFNSNVYVLIEFLLLLFQFYNWNGSHIKRYYWLGIAGAGVWLADNMIIHSITENNSLFRVFYSFAITFLSINQLNKILIFEKGPLLKNAMFIISIGFLVFFGSKAFVESFNVFRVGFSDVFLINIWTILYFVNLVTNLLYAVAMLWIPEKQKFILPF